MTDLITLAPLVLTTLTPYLTTFATAAAEEIGKKVPEAAGKVWAVLKKKFDTKEAAREALEDLLKNPKDEDTQGAFRLQLKKFLTDDPDFAGELSKLLESAGTTTTYTATLIGNGAIAQGTGATAVGAGGVNIGGSVTGDIKTGKSG
jgi:hypothetical protein